MPTFELEAPDGKTYEIEADNPTMAIKAIQHAFGGEKAAPKQEMVGFGERGQRETMEPESEDLKKEVRIAELMARGRPRFSAGDAFLHDYTFGLTDEAAGLAGGLASAFQGQDPRQGYQEGKEAENRLLQEYAEQHPTASAIAGIGGMLTGGLGRGAAEAAATTGAGKLLAPLVQSAPAASVGGRIAQGVGQGAVTGALQGFGDGDGLTDSLKDAAIGAGVGGLTGGAIPAVAEAARVVSAPFRNAVRGALRPEQEAARRAELAIQKDHARGQGLTDAQYEKAIAEGLPVANIDRGGKNTAALARSAANQSGDARSVLDDLIKPRFQTQAERIDGTLAKESHLSVPADEFMERADIAARKANAPLYNKAHALGSGTVWDDTLADLVSQSPAFKSAVQTAIKKAGDHAVVDGVGHTGNRVNLRIWDLTKRELDRLAKLAARNSDSDARTYQVLSKKLTAHLDSMGAMGKAYKEARSTAATFFKAENAFEAGLNFAGPKGGGMSTRDALKAMGKFSREERNLFKEGYIHGKREQMKELTRNRDATMSVMKSPAEEARARIAMNGNSSRRLEAQLEVEATMDLFRKEMGNSTTARQLAEMGLAGASGASVAGLTGNTDPGSLTFGGAIGAVAGATTKWGRGRISERMSTEVAKLLASGDPKKIEALIKLSEKSPQALEVVRAIRMGIIGSAARAAPLALPATSE